MKLSAEQAQKFIEYITRATDNKPIICPICGKSQWSVNNVVTEMREFQNGNLIIGGESSIMPFVSITCNNCANTLFVNAIIAGIVSPQEKQEKQKDNQK